jgi:hypothetical protein
MHFKVKQSSGNIITSVGGNQTFCPLQQFFQLRLYVAVVAWSDLRDNLGRKKACYHAAFPDRTAADDSVQQPGRVRVTGAGSVHSGYPVRRDLRNLIVKANH